MDSYLSLVASIAIGGVFLLGVMNFYGDYTDYQTQQLFQMITQENLLAIQEIVQNDFDGIGRGVDEPGNAIIAAPSRSDITFQGNIDFYKSNGRSFEEDDKFEIETVRYWLDDLASGSATPNPNDRTLFREVTYQGGRRKTWKYPGVVQFDCSLYTQAGAVTANPAQAAQLKIHLRVESPQPTTKKNGAQVYQTAIAELWVTPENLARLTNRNN